MLRAIKRWFCLSSTPQNFLRCAEVARNRGNNSKLSKNSRSTCKVIALGHRSASASLSNSIMKASGSSKMKIAKKEVEYKNKAGTAWSHSYLNQKPWHPLSYPNQRRKWIAEQTHAQKEERTAEVAREFAQEQEFFRQTAQLSKKEKESMEARQAVSFMYMRPPGYNAEAARAAEIADEKKRLGLTTTAEGTGTSGEADTSTAVPEKKNKRPKDVFGRTLPTEAEFPALKDAPRHDTGIATRVKPFAVEIRNVKCVRCGGFGHQSGDRECPLRDMLMPNDEARLKREDPLNIILAGNTGADELFNWELKQKPGLSPARGGFKPDDPNQQIIPDEDIYDEYGGFLPGGVDEGTLSIPNLLASLSHEQRKELTDVNAENKHAPKQRKGKRKYKHLDSRKSGKRGDRKSGRDRHTGDVESTSSENERTDANVEKKYLEKQRKVNRKSKHLDSRKSGKMGDHKSGRDRHAGDVNSTSSENERRHRRPIKEEPNSSEDNEDTHLRRYEVENSSGDDYLSCRTRNKDRFDSNVEYGMGIGQKDISRKADRRSSDQEGRRLRYGYGYGAKDDMYDDQRKSRYKSERRNGNEDTQSEHGRRARRDENDEELRRPRHKDRRDISDDEQRKFRYKERRDSSDGTEK